MIDEEAVQTRTLVILKPGKKVSLFSVAIHPCDMLKKGARVVFFRAETEKKVLCYLYLPEDLDDSFKEPAYSQELDRVCSIAAEALKEYGIDLGDSDFDIHLDIGELDPSDLDEED